MEPRLIVLQTTCMYMCRIRSLIKQWHFMINVGTKNDNLSMHILSLDVLLNYPGPSRSSYVPGSIIDPLMALHSLTWQPNTDNRSRHIFFLIFSSYTYTYISSRIWSCKNLNFFRHTNYACLNLIGKKVNKHWEEL